MLVNKSKNEASPIYFKNLDGLRFFAALLVFFSHAFNLHREQWGTFSQSSTFDFIAKTASYGHIGVGIFFVLSGFLIFSLFFRELERNGQIQWKHFFVRRILRIWPLYFVVILFGFLIFPHLPWGSETKHSLLNFSIFLSNFDEIWYGAQDHLNFLTVTWSISVEEQFYYFTIIAFLLIPSKYFAKILPYYFILIILSSIGFKIFHAHDERVLYYHSLSVGFYLACGGLIAYFNRDRKLEQYFKEWSCRSVLIAQIFLLCFVLGVVVTRKYNPLFFDYALAFAFSGILLLQTFGEETILSLDKVPFFKVFGKITYGFYLYHTLILFYVANWANTYFKINTLPYFVAYLLLVFTLSILVSKFSFAYFEKYFLNLKHRFKS